MKISFYIIPLLLSFSSFAQVDTVAHLYTFGGTGNDEAEEIKATSDGGYIVIGATSSNSWGNTDAYLLKVDSNCTYQWSKALGGANNDWGYAIEETHDKGFIIAVSSNSFGNGGYDAVLMKRDSLGAYQWRRTYGGNDWDFVYDIIQTYDSGYVFCGETYNNTNGFSDVWIVRTNINGDTLWTKTIGGSLTDKGNSIIETSDSSIVVGGIKNTITDSTQAYIIKLSKNGDLLWDSVYGDSLYENLNNIIEVNDGNYVFSGHTTSKSSYGDQDYLIKAININGISQWEFFIVNGPIPTPDDEDAYDIMQLPNSDILITGYSKTGGNSKNIIFFHLSSSGFWTSTSNVIGTNDDDYIKSIVIGKNGNTLGAGVSESFGNGLKDILLIKLDTVYNGQDTSINSNTDTIPLNNYDNSKKNQNFVAFPNPVSDFLFLKNSNQTSIIRISLYDVYGRRLSVDANNKKINLLDIKKGHYFLVIEFEHGIIYKQKIIKN